MRHSPEHLVERLFDKDSVGHAEVIRRLRDVGPSAIGALDAAARKASKVDKKRLEEIRAMLEADARNQKLIMDLSEFRPQRNNIWSKPLVDDCVAKAFPRYHIYLVYLKSSMMGADNGWTVAASREIGNLEVIQDPEEFFREAVGPVKSPEEAEAAVQAWLLLLRGTKGGGGFIELRFEAGAAKHEQGFRATGIAKAFMTGRQGGSYKAKARFDVDGRLTKASVEDTIDVRDLFRKGTSFPLEKVR